MAPQGSSTTLCQVSQIAEKRPLWNVPMIKTFKVCRSGLPQNKKPPFQMAILCCTDNLVIQIAIVVLIVVVVVKIRTSAIHGAI